MASPVDLYGPSATTSTATATRTPTLASTVNGYRLPTVPEHTIPGLQPTAFTTIRNHYTTLADALPIPNAFTVAAGLPLSIWNDKYARRLPQVAKGNLAEADEYESWSTRLRAVTLGNFLLLPDKLLHSREKQEEFLATLTLAVQGVIPYSGRHLQHGDAQQPNKLMDLFSNCATSPFSFLTLWKSLCGKGVSSDYSSFMRPVNWDNMPNTRFVLNGGSDDSGDITKGAHPDYTAARAEFQGAMESLRDAEHKYPTQSENVRWFKVADSRSGWASVVCTLETAAYHEHHRDKLFIFDFSGVRAAGAPIMGHQARPASGPIPLMRSLLKMASVKGAYMPPWKQAMYIDDYLAQCVSVGGIRRNARMAVMYWKDSAIFDFIEIKRGGHLRMANNTILVDAEFWATAQDPRNHAYRVFQAATAAAYFDSTGEPGFANVHKMRQNKSDIDKLTAENYLNLADTELAIHPRTYPLIDKVLSAIKRAPYLCIPNPCGEADLMSAGDDCLVGDLGLHRATTLDAARAAATLLAKSLVRVSSLMPAICPTERARTNKIGVSAIGILEFFWNHYQLGFYDLLEAYPAIVNSDEPDQSSAPCGPSATALTAWRGFESIAQAARDGAAEEATLLNVVIPDTVTLLKPGGTVAKVMAAMESANLPSRRYYLRYIQYPSDSSKIAQYQAAGYPIRDISHKYPGYVVIGFPTVQPYIKMLDAADASSKIVTANNVNIEDHYKWLRLLEHFWLGHATTGEPLGGQIAYTLKYNPRTTDYPTFMQQIAAHQPNIRCCTFNVCSSDDEVLEETTAMIENYGYAPETPITKDEYDALVAKIAAYSPVAAHVVLREEYDHTLSCENGFCAVDDDINAVAV